MLFESYISEIIGNNATGFRYNTDFKEYVISNEFKLASEERLTIRDASIGKILYSEKAQQIIYVAIGVYDGGIVTTDFLCEFFTRFGIDPREY